SSGFTSSPWDNAPAATKSRSPSAGIRYFTRSCFISPGFLSTFPMPVREVHEPVPVIPEQRMLPGSQMIADAFPHRRFRRWLLLCPHPFPAEQAIHRTGQPGSEELPLWVRPTILRGAGDINRTRGHQCDQRVLVHGQPFLMPGIALVVTAEPMGKGGSDP